MGSPLRNRRCSLAIMPTAQEAYLTPWSEGAVVKQGLTPTPKAMAMP